MRILVFCSVASDEQMDRSQSSWQATLDRALGVAANRGARAYVYRRPVREARAACSARIEGADALAAVFVCQSTARHATRVLLQHPSRGSAVAAACAARTRSAGVAAR